MIKDNHSNQMLLPLSHTYVQGKAIRFQSMQTMLSGYCGNTTCIIILYCKPIAVFGMMCACHCLKNLSPHPLQGIGNRFKEEVAVHVAALAGVTQTLLSVTIYRYISAKFTPVQITSE